MSLHLYSKANLSLSHLSTMAINFFIWKKWNVFFYESLPVMKKRLGIWPNRDKFPKLYENAKKKVDTLLILKQWWRVTHYKWFLNLFLKMKPQLANTETWYKLWLLILRAEHSLWNIRRKQVRKIKCLFCTKSLLNKLILVVS